MVRRHIATHCDQSNSYEDALNHLGLATNGNWSCSNELIRRNRVRGFIGFLPNGEDDEPDLVKAKITIPVRTGPNRTGAMILNGTGKVRSNNEAQAQQDALRNAILHLEAR